MDINVFETLKYLSNAHRDLHAKRQQYEWRIIFTVLSFYVLSVAVSFSRNTSAPNYYWFKPSVWTVFLLLATISSGFLWYIHKANAKNKSFAENAEGELVKCLNTKHDISLEFSDSNIRMTTWAFAWQSITLFLVAIASSLFITSNW